MVNPGILAASLLVPPVPYYGRLIDSAQWSLAHDDYAAAVIWAVTACEVLTEQAFDEAFQAKRLVRLGEAVGEMMQSYNLANDRVRAVYEGITGDDLSSKPWWPDFKQLLSLRNRVIHGAVRQVEREDAQRGYNAACNLINHLTKQTYGLDPNDYGPNQPPPTE